MRKFFLLLVIMIVGMQNLFSVPIIIKGHCSINYRDSLFLYTYKNRADFITYDENKMLVASVKPDTNGLFRISYELPSGQYFQMKSGPQYLFVNAFFLPEDSLFIEIGDTEDALYYGTGAKAILFYESSRNNKYMLYLQQYGLPKDSFSNLVDSLQSAENNFLQTFAKENKLSAEFIDQEKLHIYYKWKTERLRYLWSYGIYYWTFFHKVKILCVDPDYFNFITADDLDDKKGLNDDNYYWFLFEYTHELSIEKWDHLSDDFRKANDKSRQRLEIECQAYFIDSLLYGEYRNLELGKLLWQSINFLDDNDLNEKNATLHLIDSLLEKLKPTSSQTNDSIYVRIKAREGKVLSMDNKYAYCFTLPDLNNKMVSLYEFEGKVVLLDMWEVGCLPCMQGIPSSNQLQADLAGKDFAMLSLCFNSNKESWKSAIEKHKWKGTHLFASNAKDIINKYLIEGYPRYVLIDKKGIVRNSNASQDMDAMKKQIEELMKE